jgi:hypothetical protein
MILVTDIAAILAASEANAPRTVEEYIAANYPDATVDRNGRAHAPHDGYVCAVTGNAYRAGEYLPIDGDTANPGSSRLHVMDTSTRKAHVLEGTRAQIKAARDVAKAQQVAFDATREHVGTIGNKIDELVTLVARFEEDGSYGTIYTHYFRNSNLDSIVWKGSKCVGSVGDMLNISAKVKSHWTGKDGRKATYVSHVKSK